MIYKTVSLIVKNNVFLSKSLSKVYRLYLKIFRIHDFNSEYYFFYCWLPENWDTVSNPKVWKKIFPDELLKYIHKLKETNNKKIKLLEIGSGPVSMLAWVTYKNLCEVTAVDPLAKIYEKIMDEYNYSYPIKPILGYGEKLLQLFTKNTFDIVYSSNALDHTRDPKKCVENIYNVTKKNGLIVLEGYIDEGSAENWTGLHKYNISLIDGKLICSEKNGKLVDLTKGLKLQCIYQKTMKANKRAVGTPFVRASEEDWYIIIYNKL